MPHGSGLDVLSGGAGNDTITGAANDTLLAGGGIDTVITSVDYSLQAAVENGVLAAGAGGRAPRARQAPRRTRRWS